MTHLRRLDVRHVFGESVVFLGDLESQLARVAEDEHGHLPIDGLQLLQGGQDKDGGLAHTTLGLADHVHSEDSLQENQKHMRTLNVDECNSQEVRGRQMQTG